MRNTGYTAAWGGILLVFFYMEIALSFAHMQSSLESVVSDMKQHHANRRAPVNVSQGGSNECWQQLSTCSCLLLG